MRNGECGREFLIGGCVGRKDLAQREPKSVDLAVGKLAFAQKPKAANVPDHPARGRLIS